MRRPCASFADQPDYFPRVDMLSFLDEGIGFALTLWIAAWMSCEMQIIDFVIGIGVRVDFQNVEFIPTQAINQLRIIDSARGGGKHRRYQAGSRVVEARVTVIEKKKVTRHWL